jgi:hypothetical protein
VDGPGSSAALTKSTHENRTPPPVRKSDIGKAGNASGWAGEAPGILKRLFISLTGLLSPEPNKGECAVSKLNNDETFFIKPSCCRFFLLDVIFDFIVNVP